MLHVGSFPSAKMSWLSHEGSHQKHKQTGKVFLCHDRTRHISQVIPRRTEGGKGVHMPSTLAPLIIQGCYQSVQVTASVASAADDDGVDSWMHPAHLAALLWTLLPPVPVAQQAVMVVVVDLDCTLAGDALRVHRQLEVVAPANIVKADTGRTHPSASCGARHDRLRHVSPQPPPPPPGHKYGGRAYRCNGGTEW